jgi:catechol 2,3-dioxygenase-like lactoylglutathione lyase family enzyme
MKRVTGIGGIFFKSKDPQALREWYRAHLGIESDGEGGASFHWRDADDPERKGLTVWSAFPQDTNYFKTSSAPFMINYRVENLDWLLEQLRAEGLEVDPRIEEYEYGRFA